MRGALKLNACPFCTGKILSDAKAQQYVNLLTVLDQAVFTNKADIDTQIKDKVVQLMLDNFVFMKLDNPEVRSDIIVVSDEEEQKVISKPPVEIKPAKVEKKDPPKQKVEVDEEEEDDEDDDYPDQPTRSLPKKRPTPRAPAKGGLSMKDYIAAQDESFSDNEAEVDVNEASIDEILKVFPQLSKEEALNALRADSEMKKVKMPQKGLTGKGIKRL
jgi:hypothetical protein